MGPVGKPLQHSLDGRTVQDRRWGKRRPAPALAVYYWDGGTPRPHPVRDVSSSGVFLLCQETLYPGGMLLLTLQREDVLESGPDQWIAAHALVVRRDAEGVALSFVFPRSRHSRLSVVDLANGATRDEMAVFQVKLFAAGNAVIATKNDEVSARLHSAIKDGPRIRTTRTAKVCVCDLTRGNLLGRDMSVIDFGADPLQPGMEVPSSIPASGIWLSPFRGLPAGTGQSPFDLIFLDDKNAIVELVEQFAVTERATFHRNHASALLFTSGTISSSRIALGDQLRVCSPESRATALADPLYTMAGSSQRSRVAQTKHLHCLRDAAALVSSSGVEQVANQPRLQMDARDASPVMWDTPERRSPFLRWLLPPAKPQDRRRSRRTATPRLLAFYNTGGEPKAFKVGDVSSSGFYLNTDARWLPGTRLVITLQKENCSGHDAADWTRVESKVVRFGADGVGFQFMTRKDAEILRGNEFDPEAFQQFLAQATPAPGNSPPPMH